MSNDNAVPASDPWASLYGLTAAASRFVATHRYADLNAATTRLARRCILDGLAVALAGTEQTGMQPIGDYITSLGGCRS